MGQIMLHSIVNLIRQQSPTAARLAINTWMGMLSLAARSPE